MSLSRKYQTARGAQVETQPGSHGRVLRNLLQITRKREMDRVEYESLLRVQDTYLHHITPGTRFTIKLLNAMHHDWLGHIYEWAGEYRTVEMEKDGFQWPPAYLIEQNMRVFQQAQLDRCTPCKPAPLSVVAQDMAEVHGELLLIHPYRDGNGRLARWLADLMALQAHMPAPDYAFTGRGAKRQQKRYLHAVQQAYIGNYGFLADFFADAIEGRIRRLRV